MTFVSIEPYPSPALLASRGAIERALRFGLVDRQLEAVGLDVTSGMQRGDVLFIDSSHVYRPGSDVEFEFRELIPHLPAGAFLHVHDVFIPLDYPDEWNRRDRRWLPLAQLAQLARERRAIFEERLGRVFSAETRPGSLWLRLND